MLHLVSYWPDKLQLFLLLSFKIYFEVHYISAKIEEAHHRCNKIKKDKPKKTLSPPPPHHVRSFSCWKTQGKRKQKREENRSVCCHPLLRPLQPFLLALTCGAWGISSAKAREGNGRRESGHKPQQHYPGCAMVEVRPCSSLRSTAFLLFLAFKSNPGAHKRKISIKFHGKELIVWK